MAGAGIARQYASGPRPAQSTPADRFAQRVGGSGTNRGVHAGNGLHRPGDRRRRQHAHRDQVLAAVVVDRDRLVRRRARAHEPRGLHVRLLLAAVARADLRQRRRRGHLGGHLAARGRRAVRLRSPIASLARFSAIAAPRRPAARRARSPELAAILGGVFPDDALRPLAEERDADDADVVGASGARRVGVGRAR